MTCLRTKHRNASLLFILAVFSGLFTLDARKSLAVQNITISIGNTNSFAGNATNTFSYGVHFTHGKSATGTCMVDEQLYNALFGSGATSAPLTGEGCPGQGTLGDTLGHRSSLSYQLNLFVTDPTVKLYGLEMSLAITADKNCKSKDCGPISGTGTISGGGQSATGTVTDVELVPGPLPLLGAVAAFGYSRKLRKSIKASQPEVISTTAL
jgi:hypothetical protein